MKSSLDFLGIPTSIHTIENSKLKLQLNSADEALTGLARQDARMALRSNPWAPFGLATP